MQLGNLEATSGFPAAVPDPVVRESVAPPVRCQVLTLRPTSRGKIIGRDPAIRAVLQTIDRVARSACTVLVTGESGTGKELIVAALHDASERREHPLVTISCGAIPNELVESELFGHARGAFTGAQVSRRGHVAEAEGGTLFLDEVGELPLLVQVKLLRLVQQREYMPLGESHAVKCDVRIVAATNRDLEADVKSGRFREDLYYRLNVIRIRLPPLRERKEDIRLLATHFFRTFAGRCGRTDLRGLSSAALVAIEAHSWPGNIRDLENAIERGVLLANGPYVEAADVLASRGGGGCVSVEATTAGRFDPRCEAEPDSGVYPIAPVRAVSAAPGPILSIAPAALRPIVATVPSAPGTRHGSNPQFPRVLPAEGVTLATVSESYENNLIRQALLRTGGNKSRAAQLLGLNRTTLVEMIRRRSLQR